MLPKQLKDSQRHQRQPKQVELFLQSSFNSPTNAPLKSSTTAVFFNKNMPQSYQYKTPNIPHCSLSSSPARYSPSHHFSGQYISPDSFAEAIKQCDNLALVVSVLEGDPVSFTKFVFLDYVTNSFLLLHVQNMLLLTLFHLWSTCIYLKADTPFSYVYLVSYIVFYMCSPQG